MPAKSALSILGFKWSQSIQEMNLKKKKNIAVIVYINKKTKEGKMGRSSYKGKDGSKKLLKSNEIL